MRAVARGGASQGARPGRADAQAGSGRIALRRQGGSGRVRGAWLRPMQRGSAGGSSFIGRRCLAMCWKRGSGRSPKPARRGGCCCWGIWTRCGRWARCRRMPCRVREGRLWGPGTLDMKAGVAMALTAIEMLTEAVPAAARDRAAAEQRRGGRQSGVAADYREDRARNALPYLCWSRRQGLAYKTARKGTGNWRIEIKGVAAHAGVDFEKGASALRELARVMETVSGWTDLETRPDGECRHGRRGQQDQCDSG